MQRRVLIAAAFGAFAAGAPRAQPVSPDESRDAGQAALDLCALLDAGRADEAVARMKELLARQPGVSPTMLVAIEERLRFEIDKRGERSKRSNPRVVTVSGRGGGDIFSVVVEADAEPPSRVNGVVERRSHEVVEVQRRPGGGFEPRRYEFVY